MSIRASTRSIRALAPVVLCALASCQSDLPKRLSPSAEYFRPAARVYFDTGTDDDGELDVFRDGALSPAVDFLGITFPYLVKGNITKPAEGELALVREEVENAIQANLDALKHENSLREDYRNAAKLTLDRMRTATPPDSEVLEFLRLPIEDQWKSKLLDTHPELQGLRSLRDTIDAARAKVLASEIRLNEAKKDEEMLEGLAERKHGTRIDGDWVVGPRFAVGLTSPAGDSEDGTESSGAPVLFLSAGLFADFYKGDLNAGDDDGVGVRLEAGFLYGVSADESFSNADDSAIFVGMTVFL